MMRLTIIVSDGAVYKDDVCMVDLTLAGAPNNVHALQWFGDKGWIEFVLDENFAKPANETITELPDWAITAAQQLDGAVAVAQQAGIDVLKGQA